MAQAIFYFDSSVREFEAEVVAVDGETSTVVLDRTAFYPGGGGQPCDRGRIEWPGGIGEVVDVRRDGGDVAHRLEGGLPQAGTRVSCQLDWPRRHALMRTHTALHILCGVIWRDYGAQVTGGNMQPLSGRLDFELEGLSAELVEEIERRINVEVEAEREVRVQTLPRAVAEAIPDLIRTKINLLPKGLTEIRTVEIVGLDLQADGGTHVANTRQVGPIRIAGYKSKGRLNKRLMIELEA